MEVTQTNNTESYLHQTAVFGAAFHVTEVANEQFSPPWPPLSLLESDCADLCILVPLWYLSGFICHCSSSLSSQRCLLSAHPHTQSLSLLWSPPDIIQCGNAQQSAQPFLTLKSIILFDIVLSIKQISGCSIIFHSFQFFILRGIPYT